MLPEYASQCKYCGKNGGSKVHGTQGGGPPTVSPPRPSMGCPNSPDKKHYFKWVRVS